jgi:hypothetical protein
VLAEGVERVWIILLSVSRPIALLVSVFLVVHLLHDPIIIAYKNLQTPPMKEHIKPVMSYLSKSRLNTDLIYIYHGTRPAFEFYAPLYGFARNDYIAALSDRNGLSRYIQDIDNLKGNQRVWFVFSHNFIRGDVNEQLFILEHLNEIGMKRSGFMDDGASVHLYDLTQLPLKNPPLYFNKQ